jgi:hypothetical protein
VNPIALNLNTWGLALLTVGFFLLVCHLGLWASYRFFPRARFGEDSTDPAALYITIIGLIFALIFALDITAVWANYDQVCDVVSKEADNLNTIYRNLDAYPEAFREPVQARLKAYADRLVHVEFPLLAEGRNGGEPAARQMIAEIDRQITGYQVADAAEKPLHRQMLRLLAEGRALRAQRLEGAEPYLGPPMWISLVLGTVLVMVFSCLFNMPGRRQHYLMHASLAASVGVVFLLLVAYNAPFRGPGAITSDDMRMLSEKMWLPGTPLTEGQAAPVASAPRRNAWKS